MSAALNLATTGGDASLNGPWESDLHRAIADNNAEIEALLQWFTDEASEALFVPGHHALHWGDVTRGTRIAAALTMAQIAFRDAMGGRAA